MRETECKSNTTRWPNPDRNPDGMKPSSGGLGPIRSKVGIKNKGEKGGAKKCKGWPIGFDTVCAVKASRVNIKCRGVGSGYVKTGCSGPKNGRGISRGREWTDEREWAEYGTEII